MVTSFNLFQILSKRISLYKKTMSEFKENTLNLLPVIITILIVGMGYFINESTNNSRRESNIMNIKNEIHLLRQEIDNLDDKKVNKELFEHVMLELQRMNNTLDDMNNRINKNTSNNKNR